MTRGIANRLLDYVDGDSVKNVVQPDVDLNEDKFTKTMYNNGLSYYNGLFQDDSSVDTALNDSQQKRGVKTSSLEAVSANSGDSNKAPNEKTAYDFFEEYKLYLLSIPLLLSLILVAIAYRSVIK